VAGDHGGGPPPRSRIDELVDGANLTEDAYVARVRRLSDRQRVIALGSTTDEVAAGQDR